MSEQLDISGLVDSLDVAQYGSDTVGVLLTGSFAKGTATSLSDVDLILSSAEIQVDDQRIFRHGERLVILNIQTRATLEAILSDPRSACRYLRGLLHAVPLVDRDGSLRDLQERAARFTWTEPLRAAAGRQAALELIGWLEEVHKGVAGLLAGDSGKMLQAVHGCSWGMLRVAQLGLMVLEDGDNSVVTDVMNVVGSSSEWSNLLRSAIGLTTNQLPERVADGLQLFCLTAAWVKPSLLSNEMELIWPTVATVKSFLRSRSGAVGNPTISETP